MSALREQLSTASIATLALVHGDLSHAVSTLDEQRENLAFANPHLSTIEEAVASVENFEHGISREAFLNEIERMQVYLRENALKVEPGEGERETPVTDLFARLHQTWPTPIGRHNITYNVDTDKLEVRVLIDGLFSTFVLLNEDELGKGADLIFDFQRLLEEKKRNAAIASAN
jgi:hypothetical protein